MSVTTPPATSVPPLIDVEQLFADPVFSGASISPDGARLAYLAPKYGRTNVWVRGIDEEHEQAVCVTHDKRRGIRNYRWTDDPRWLLYMQDTDGNEDWHLYRADLEAPDQPAVDLTPMEPGCRVLGFDLMKSEPGNLIVSMNRREKIYADAFKINIATGETTVYRETPELTGSFFFGPSGEVFYSKQVEGGFFDYYTVDEAGETKLFHRRGGPEHPLGIYPAHVTSDGKGLLLGVYHDGSDDLAMVRIDVETGEETLFASLPGHSVCTMGMVTPTLPPSLLISRRTEDVMAVRFVGDRPIVKPVDDHFAEVFAELSKLSDGVLASVSSDVTEQKWVATFVHDREPGLAYYYDHATKESRLLFRPYPQLDPEHLAPMTAVHLTARDGLPLHAFLTLPVGIDPVGLPLVLKVHGGPWCHDMWGYDGQTQFFANRGYAVLQVNFRGSSGYGARHITAAIHELGGKMHDDLIDAANWAVEQGIADPKRIGIYGGSYGGYATLIGVTVTPDFFAAAVDYVGISNLANFMRTLPPFVKPFLSNSWYLYVGDPDDPAQEADMLSRSAITMVDRIKTPLLVVQGANDVRVVKAEADNIVNSLRERGVPVEYIVAEDEGHGFQNPENVIGMFRAIDAHFAEHLGGRSGVA